MMWSGSASGRVERFLRVIGGVALAGIASVMILHVAVVACIDYPGTGGPPKRVAAFTSARADHCGVLVTTRRSGPFIAAVLKFGIDGVIPHSKDLASLVLLPTDLPVLCIDEMFYPGLICDGEDARSSLRFSEIEFADVDGVKRVGWVSSELLRFP